MMILSALLVVAGYLGVQFGGPVWVAAATCSVPLLLYLLHDVGAVAWRDDFQREVAMRSGMHALVAVGLICAMVLATNNTTELVAREGGPGYGMTMMAALTLRIAAIIWGLSWLVQYWGGRIGAIRILWVLLGISFIETAGTTMLRVHGNTAGGMTFFARLWFYPLIALAIVGCRRWPRAGGVVLCVFLIGKTWFVAHSMAAVGLMEDTLVQTSMIAMTLPLLVPALTLLSARRVGEA